VHLLEYLPWRLIHSGISQSSLWDCASPIAALVCPANLADQVNKEGALDGDLLKLSSANADTFVKLEHERLNPSQADGD